MSRPRFESRRTLAPQPAPGLYASTYTPERGAAICRRLAAGESLRSICRADPAMPTEKTVWNWARAHEEFRLMKRHALATARAAALQAQGERDAARRAQVGSRGGQSWRAGADHYGPEVREIICTRVMMGESVTAICRDSDMPSIGAVYWWLRRYPEFLADYRRSKAMVEEIMVEQACEGLQWIGMRKSEPMLRRTVIAAEKRAARLSLKRYAEPEGPERLVVTMKEPDGSSRVIYGAGDEPAAPLKGTLRGRWRGAERDVTEGARGRLAPNDSEPGRPRAPSVSFADTSPELFGSGEELSAAPRR
ncbi:MAG: terminase small subunit protein [Phenylobacterium sp.]|nr:terminase small subunit protein [Phenylobacterium sp.]